VGGVILVVVGTFATVVGVLGADAEGVRTAVRFSGASSLVLFLLAYSASSLQRRWPGPATRRLRSLRRYVGISFGIGHLLHGCALIWLASLSTRSFDELGILLMALLSFGYLFVIAMLLTSSDRAQAALGPRLWQGLHRVGLHYVWLLFFVAYARALGSSLWSVIPFAAVLLALALRWTPRRSVG
jgi:hypothetical protein